jgi:magnesium transporter
MNFEHMSELQWQYAYAVALLLIVVACGYLYCRLRRAGWL